MNRKRRQSGARKLRSRQFIICGLLVVMLFMFFNIIQAADTPVEAADRVSVAEASQTNLALSESLYLDNSHLTLGLHGSQITLVKEGERYIEPGAFCIDDRFGMITNPLTTGYVDTSVPGDYLIIYTFTSENAKCSIERTVRVVPEDEFEEDADGVPVLMYHYVYTKEDVPEKLNGNYILDTDLEAQLYYLKEEGYYYPSISELRAYINGELSLPKKSVILTFDDAQKGFYEYGYPLLEKYEIPAISFAIGIEAEYKVKERTSPFVCFESHSFDMHREGGNIGHGGRISAMEYEEIVEDLNQAIKLFGSGDAFAYPYGDVTDTAQLALKSVGVKCSFTTEYGKVKVGDDYTKLPRIRIHGTTSLDGFKASL